MPDDQSNAPTKAEILERLRRVRNGLRITKITCTRSVKGRNGDSFVGYSAAWQSVQDDSGGPGADVQAGPEEDRAYANQGMRIEDAKIARYMLAMEADIAALESAAANGSISPRLYQDSVASVKANYNRFVLRAMGVPSNDETPRGENPPNGEEDGR